MANLAPVDYDPFGDASVPAPDVAPPDADVANTPNVPAGGKDASASNLAPVDYDPFADTQLSPQEIKQRSIANYEENLKKQNQENDSLWNPISAGKIIASGLGRGAERGVLGLTQAANQYILPPEYQLNKQDLADVARQTRQEGAGNGLGGTIAEAALDPRYAALLATGPMGVKARGVLGGLIGGTNPVETANDEEATKEREKQAAINAGAFMALPPLISGAGKIASKVAGIPVVNQLLRDESSTGPASFVKDAPFQNIFKNSSQESSPLFDKGTALAVKIMQDQGMSPEEIYNSVLASAKSKQSGLPTTVLEEAKGPAGLGVQQGLTEGRSPATSRGGAELTAYNTARENEAIPKAMEDTFGANASTSSPVEAANNAMEAASSMIKQASKDRTAAVAPKYAEVMGKKIPPTWLQNLLEKNPVLNQEYNSAQGNPVIQQLLSDASEEHGIEIPDNSIGFLDVLKKSLDGKIAASKTNFGASTAETKALTSARNRLVSALDDLNPKYAEARAAYGDESKFVTDLQDSLVGNISKAKSEESLYNTLFGHLPEKISQAREMFHKAGNGQQWDDLVASYVSRLDDKSTGSAESIINKIAKNPDVTDRIKAAIGPENHEAFDALVENLQKIRSSAPRGSNTGPKFQSMQYLEPKGSPLADQVNDHGPFRRVFDYLGNKITKGMDERAAAEAQQKNFDLAKAITSPDLDKYKAVIDGLSKKDQVSATAKWLSDKLPQSAVPAAAGVTAENALEKPKQSFSAPTVENSSLVAPATATAAPITQQAQKLPPIQSMLHGVAKTTGIDPDFFTGLANAESALKPKAANPNSSAKGLFQFTKSTWKDMVDKYGDQYGVELKDINDPEANALMAAELTKENYNTLKNTLNREPTKGELYAAHFLGADGAQALIAAKNSNVPATKLVSPEVVRANRSIFINNNRARPANEVFRILAKKVKLNLDKKKK